MSRVCRLFLFLFLPLLLNACNGLIFQPERKHYIEPAQLNIDARDIHFRSSDGLGLHGWFLPAKTRPARASVLFLHGNAQNISTHIASVYWLPDAGFNVFLFDYRGYGYSGGTPDLEGVQRDFRAALARLRNMEGVDAKRIFIFGQSLGAAIAITGLADLPEREGIQALITEGAFTGYRDIAREALAGFWLTWPFQWPLSFLITDCCRPADAIAGISPIPVLIVHSRDDRIIPFHHAIELYTAARDPKRLWLFNGYPHIQIFRQAENRQRLIDYMLRILAQNASG